MQSFYFLVSLSIAVALPQDQPTFQETGEQTRAQVAATANGWKDSIVSTGTNWKNHIVNAGDTALGATVQGTQAVGNTVGDFAHTGKDKFKQKFNHWNEEIQGNPGQ